MRTKHLFYTAAMAALFAACVNDDFETIGQQGNVANDGRPVAGDVKLNFTKAGADTRLDFGSNGYAWEASDEIGALLMDNVKLLGDAAKDKSWLQKYELVDNIHTSYRFYYDSQNEEWKADAKMLEGNYFFAYPWEDYDGNRQVAHSLINQEQNGIGGSVVAESYANNQFFIGYSQIKAGTGTNEVLDSSVEMVPLLGAIQLRITNTGTQTYHINKVVLSNHTGLASVLTFDPTTATYTNPDDVSKNWNLAGNSDVTWTQTSGKSYFNYANYLGVDGEAELYTNKENPVETDYVYNREDGDKYSRIEALRKVVKPLANVEKSAQLVINGTADERAILPGVQNTAYVLIMCNPLEEVEAADNNPTTADNNTLYLSIYTDEGFVQNIDLGKIYNESTENKVTTNAKVETVAPNVSNTITIQIDDNSFITPDKMDIFNSADLEQFIKWNVAEDATRNIEATLMQDVTLTADMVDALVNDKKSATADGQTTLKLIGKNGAKLTLAADVPANVLDNEEIVLGADVNLVVEGELALTEDSEMAASIEVAEEGKLTINDAKVTTVPTITNNGALTLGANSAVKNGTITNFGVMNVEKGGDSKATVNNEKDAVINNDGFMQNVINKKEATIVLGENATISVNNSGKVETAKGATVNGTNYGEIVYVEGAVVNASNSGTEALVAYEFTGSTITDETFKDMENINKIILTKSTTVTKTTGLDNVEITEGGELIVDEKVVFTVKGELTISGEATIKANGTGENKGKVVAANVVVEEEGVLNNSGVIQASTKFEYEGIVYNNGTIYTNNLVNVDNKGTWKYNDKENIPTTPEDKQQTTMDAAVATWAGLWDTYLNNQSEYGKYYSGNPYDVNSFIESLNEWKTNVNSDYHKVATDLYEQWCVADDGTTTTFEKVLKDAQGNANSKFTTAVNKVLATKATDAGEVLLVDGKWNNSALSIAQSTVAHENETAAQEALYTTVAGMASSFSNDYIAAAYIWTEADSETKTYWTAFETANPYTYIWMGNTCPLYEVVKVYVPLGTADWREYLGNEDLESIANETNGMENLVDWMKTVANYDGNNSFAKAAKTVVEKYLNNFGKWDYSGEQIVSMVNAVNAENK